LPTDAEREISRRFGRDRNVDECLMHIKTIDVGRPRTTNTPRRPSALQLRDNMNALTKTDI
jgi:hypothetical protein